MNEEQIIATAREALLTAIAMGAPILLMGLLVGVTVALFQALTQIQEVTLVFVPKILTILLAMYFFLPSIMKTLVIYTNGLASNIVQLGLNG